MKLEAVAFVGALLVMLAPAWALDPLARAEGEARLLPQGRTLQLEPVVGSAAEALPAALAALRLKPRDITFDPPAEDRDVHRRRIVDRVLAAPHTLEAEVDGAAATVLEAGVRPEPLLKEMCRLGDLAWPGTVGELAGDREALEHFCGARLDDRDVSTRVALARLGALPAELRRSLSGLLRAHARARELMTAEAAKVDDAGVAVLLRSSFGEDGKPQGGEKEVDRIDKLLAVVAKLDRAKPMLALALVANAAHDTAQALRGLSEGQRRSIPTIRVPGRFGNFFLGGAQDDVTGARDVLVVDVGGDDRHDLAGARDPRRGFGGTRVIVDGGGNDRYFARDLPLAGGFCGVGLVWDSSGDDIYDADRCSLGAGLCGAGMLVDSGGDDSYRVREMGQGFSAFGFGVLVDSSGNDSYHARGQAQGSAGPGGVALCVDAAGHDSYYTNGGERDFRGEFFDSFAQGFAVGFRNQASGGVGGLIDGGGNDTYAGDYWAQGVGYWYGLGFLVDRGGNDRYGAGRYAQGAGVHLALGALLDGGGHDAYTATAVSQGCGYDLAAGLLRDRSGNDTYQAHDFAQGRGFANGYGLLRDDAGADFYFSWATDAQGYGQVFRGFGSVGVLLDLGGLDRYAPAGRNNTVMTRGADGVLLDAALSK